MDDTRHKKGLTHQGPGRAPRRFHVVIPALENLASRMTVGTTGYTWFDKPPHRMGDVETCDHAITLVNVCREHPVWWWLFWAKYMSDRDARLDLGGWLSIKLVQKGLAKHRVTAPLVHLLLEHYCDGKPLTGRKAGKVLSIDRKAVWGRMRAPVDATLVALYTEEENVGKEMQRWTRNG